MKILRYSEGDAIIPYVVKSCAVVVCPKADTCPHASRASFCQHAEPHRYNDGCDRPSAVCPNCHTNGIVTVHHEQPA